MIDFKDHINRMFQSSSFDDGLHHILICRFALDLEGRKQFTINFVGALCVTNSKLVDLIDKMVLDRCGLILETNNGATSSATLACLCIGYMNMAFWAQVTDKSKSPSQKHNFSAEFAQLIFLRIDDLVSNIMEFVRYETGHDDAESRSGVHLLYLYLSVLQVKRRKLGCSKIFVRSLSISLF